MLSRGLSFHIQLLCTRRLLSNSSTIFSASREEATASPSSADELKHFLSKHNVRVMGGEISQIITEFSKSGFKPNVIAELQKTYTEPTPIQSLGWSCVAEGRDLVGLAHTGTGKTLAFLLPGLHKIATSRKPTGRHNIRFPIAPKMLIMAPTRELAAQISTEAERFGNVTGVNSGCVFGGVKTRAQISELMAKHKRYPIEVLIGTPGRLIDLTENCPDILDLSKVEFAVLDEADRMLDMGFEPQIRTILSCLPGAKCNDSKTSSSSTSSSTSSSSSPSSSPSSSSSSSSSSPTTVSHPKLQILMWSATWPTEVKDLAADYLRDHLTVRVGDDRLQTAPTIKQHFENLRPSARYERLLQLLSEWRQQDPKSKVLIFASTKTAVDFLQLRLEGDDIRTVTLHGDKSQQARLHAMSDFRKHSNVVLVATDIAARGLDVSDITHVVNYNLPNAVEDYVHRIGRTGRAGNHGVSYTFFDDRDSKMVTDLCELLVTSGQEVPDPLLDMKHALDAQKNRFSRAPSRAPKARFRNILDEIHSASFSRSTSRDSDYYSSSSSPSSSSSSSSRFTNGYSSPPRSNDRYSGSSFSNSGDRYSGSSFSRSNDRYSGSEDRHSSDRYTPRSNDRYSSSRSSDRYSSPSSRSSDRYSSSRSDDRYSESASRSDDRYSDDRYSYRSSPRSRRPTFDESFEAPFSHKKSSRLQEE